MDTNKINSNELVFTPGEEVELYFFDEQVEYRFPISARKFKDYEGHLILSIPHSRIKSFYKGEDFVQCRYVHDNIVYEFHGEIMRIIKDDMPSVIIKVSQKFKEFNQRKKNRISVDIPSEFQIIAGVPGIDGNSRGFAMIKDASLDGLSFLTSDIIPTGAIIELNLYRNDIILNVEVKKVQLINEKNFYGGRVVNLEEPTKSKYAHLLEKTLTMDKIDIIY